MIREVVKNVVKERERGTGPGREKRELRCERDARRGCSGQVRLVVYPFYTILLLNLKRYR